MAFATGINLETGKTELFDFINVSKSGTYKGLWDASTNTPFLTNGAGEDGDYYEVSVGGTVNFGEGDIIFVVGDTVAYSRGKWQKGDKPLINDEEIAYDTTWSSAKILQAIEAGTSADVFVYKGEVDELPETAVLGQVYKLTTTSLAYWWDGTKFEEFKQDLSAYYTKTETDTLLAGKVDKETGKGLSTEDFTTAEKTKLAGIEDGAEVNKIEKILLNGVEQTPDTQREVALTVITRLVDDLANYYKKTETYTKDEVNTLIGNIETLKLIKVETLPVTDIDTSAIYLLPSDDPQQQNVYTEYMYIDNAWEIIGSTAIDLSGYVTIDYLNGVLAGYVASLDSSVSNLQTMTREEFNALTQAQKDALPNGTIIFNASEATPNITNIVDVVESGNMNPVSSNAVATSVSKLKEAVRYTLNTQDGKEKYIKFNLNMSTISVTDIYGGKIEIVGANNSTANPTYKTAKVVRLSYGDWNSYDATQVPATVHTKIGELYYYPVDNYYYLKLYNYAHFIITGLASTPETVNSLPAETSEMTLIPESSFVSKSELDGTIIKTTVTTDYEYYAIVYGDDFDDPSNQGILIQYKRSNFPPSTYIFSAVSYSTNTRETVNITKINNSFAGLTYALRFYVDKENKTVYLRLPSYSSVALQNLTFKSKVVAYTKVDAIPNTATEITATEYATKHDLGSNVALTNITFNTDYAESTSGGHGSTYTIVNGICYVNLDMRMKANSQILFILPKPVQTVVNAPMTVFMHNLTEGAEAVNNGVLILRSNGEVSTVGALTNESRYMLNFSYPVKK